MLVVLLVVVCLLAIELGMWWGRVQLGKATVNYTPLTTQELGMILGSVFGMLALLASLSFSITLDRYDERRVLTATEANATRAT